MSKKTKLNEDTPSKVSMFEYSGQDVPKNVTHVRFHPSVVEVDIEAFYNCKSLRGVVLNDGLKGIGKSAFEDCSALQSTNIPSTVTKIGMNAFEYCSSLREIVLNEGLKEIGSYAFRGCESLQSINIPSTVTKIDNAAFYECIN